MQRSYVRAGALASQDRMSGVDALRAVAVLLTFAMHYSWFYLATYLSVDPEHTTLARTTTLAQALALLPYFSLYGVYLFFMISGYLIGGRWLRESSPPIIDYMRDRAWRIFPAFWVALFAAWALNRARGINVDASFVDVLSNATLLNWFAPEAHPPWLIVSWSLQVEWLFYIAMPITAWLLRRVPHTARVWTLWILTALLCVMLKSVGERHFAYPAFFAVGIFVALKETDVRHWAVRIRMFPVIAGILVLHGLYAFAEPIGAAKPPWSIGFFDGFSLLFILIGGAFFIKTTFEPPKWVVTRALIALGRISYSFYLWHLLVLIAIFDLANKTSVSSWVVALPSWLRALLLFSLGLGVSVMVATASYRVFEMPYFTAHARRRQR